MSYERGPRFTPAESDDPARRLRRLEDWAGRHDQWATQTLVELRQRGADMEGRMSAIEGKVVRLLAAVGEHGLKWGIVAWIVGTAAAATIALLAG
ncbi:MAG: hypothetical protein KDB73_12260 [Planctomycetes bacterium]|nr:hypothetical protein [Planctomycetota bacterium]